MPKETKNTTSVEEETPAQNEIWLQFNERALDKTLSDPLLANQDEQTKEGLELTPTDNQSTGHQTTGAQTMFNLIKNIVGAGVLSLPSGVAAGTGIVPAILITTILGMYSAWTFSKLGEMCHRNDAYTFAELGEKVRGKGFAKLMTLTCTIKTFFTCFVYSLVICDSWTQILAGFGFYVGRDQVLLSVTVFVLLPLCLMENLSVLSYTSLLGSGGMLFTLCFMVQRFFDESYLPGGQYYESVATQLHPSFEDAPGLFMVHGFQTLTLVSLLSTAFIAHYNAPKFYKQVVNRSPSRFSKISFASFITALVIFLAFMIVGYMTFGMNSQGFILNNYSAVDPLATAARTAISTSMILTYPLGFTGLRDGTAGLLGDRVNRTLLTIGLLTFITAIAFVVTDVGFLNAIQGAILGSALIYCFPGMILIYYAESPQGQTGLEKSTVLIARCTVLLGIVLGLCGATVTILQA